MSAHAGGVVGGPASNALLNSLRRVQLTRSSIVAQLHRPNLGEAITGLYVRVLLELENGGEEYKIARILTVERGAEYSGFTYDATVTTDQYLVLELSPPAKSDNHYQLNSVSNKEFQVNEYQVWQRDVSLGRLCVPSETELNITLLERLRALTGASSSSFSHHQAPSAVLLQDSAVPSRNGPVGVSAGGISSVAGGLLRNGSGAAMAAAAGGPPAPQGARHVATSDSLGVGVASSSSTNNHPSSNLLAGNPALQSVGNPVALGGGPVPVDEDSSESDYEQTDEELRRTVEEELRERHFVVPKELLEQSTQELRRLDRDVGEYIEKIRENLENNATKCIACMVHDPAVIILPCKHKVLCRGCCTKVLICPMCRKKIREVFEPVEM